MIRVTLLWIVIAALVAYAWKEWQKALCGLILLMAVNEHPDLPTNVFGIQGFNAFNILLFGVVVGWARNRRRDKVSWDMPNHISVLLAMYVGVVVVSFLRMNFDRQGLPVKEFSSGTIWSEYLINTLKFAVPGVLVFDGCRSRERQRHVAWAVAGLYGLLALQVIKWMPLEWASNERMASRAAKIMKNEIGYSRVTVSMMLSGGGWAWLSLMPLVNKFGSRVCLIAAFAAIAYAQAMTGGRTGYAAWALIGIGLGLLRWKRYLVLAPAILLCLVVLVPSAVARMSQGFATQNGRTVVDDYEVTSGRTLAWPFVLAKISEAPVVGYGQQAMRRTGLTAQLGEESFPHPHNAYLELLLDSGLVGFVIVLPFYLVVIYRAGQLLRDGDALCTAVGGITLALVLALLVAAMGSQSFYPQNDGVGMWAAIGLTLRMSVDRERDARRPRADRSGCLDEMVGVTKAKGRVTPAAWRRPARPTPPIRRRPLAAKTRDKSVTVASKSSGAQSWVKPSHRPDCP